MSGMGAVISEFPMHTRPDKQTFPMRNRIISGLSQGVLVVEAAEASGALISANQALEQGRAVFAIPGPINRFTSAGTNRLIQQGAKLVMQASEILEISTADLSINKPLDSDCSARTVSSADANSEFTSKKSAIQRLTHPEAAVFAIIDEQETPIDLIIGRSGLKTSQVIATLFDLEMKNLVQQLPGKFMSGFSSGRFISVGTRRPAFFENRLSSS